MCFVLQNNLGKGARCALPLHPSGLRLFRGIEPASEPVDRIADQPLAGDFALPAPNDPFRKTRGYRAPRNPLVPFGRDTTTRGRSRPQDP